MTLNQLKQLIERNPLTLPVARQMGYPAIRSNKQDREEFIETLREVHRHGADVGWGGFVYYRETCAFATKHYRQILSQVHEFERETGEPFKTEGTYRDEDEDTALNWCAWFALESVANAAEQLEDEGKL